MFGDKGAEIFLQTSALGRAIAQAQQAEGAVGGRVGQVKLQLFEVCAQQDTAPGCAGSALRTGPAVRHRGGCRAGVTRCDEPYARTVHTVQRLLSLSSTQRALR